MDIRNYHEKNQVNENYEFWRIHWLIGLFNFIVKNKNKQGYPVEVWRTRVTEKFKTVIIDEKEYSYPELEFIKIENCRRSRLPLVLKALGSLMLYLFGFNVRRMFTHGLRPEEYPRFLPNCPIDSKKLSDIYLNEVYATLVSGKAEHNNCSVIELLEKAFTFSVQARVEEIERIESLSLERKMERKREGEKRNSVKSDYSSSELIIKDIDLKTDWIKFGTGENIGKDKNSLDLQVGDMVMLSPDKKIPQANDKVGKIREVIVSFATNNNCLLIDFAVNVGSVGLEKAKRNLFIGRDAWDLELNNRPSQFIIITFDSNYLIKVGSQKEEELCYWQRRYFNEEKINKMFSLKQVVRGDGLKGVISGSEKTKFKKGDIVFSNQIRKLMYVVGYESGGIMFGRLYLGRLIGLLQGESEGCFIKADSSDLELWAPEQELELLKNNQNTGIIFTKKIK